MGLEHELKYFNRNDDLQLLVGTARNKNVYFGAAKSCWHVVMWSMIKSPPSRVKQDKCRAPLQGVRAENRCKWDIGPYVLLELNQFHAEAVWVGFCGLEMCRILLTTVQVYSPKCNKLCHIIWTDLLWLKFVGLGWQARPIDTWAFLQWMVQAQLFREAQLSPWNIGLRWCLMVSAGSALEGDLVPVVLHQQQVLWRRPTKQTGPLRPSPVTHEATTMFSELLIGGTCTFLHIPPGHDYNGVGMSFLENI